jgi:ribose transport system permease protein
VVGVALRESAGRDATQTKKTGWALLRSLPLSDAGPVATLIALVAVFAASSPQFLTIENAQAILESSAIPIVLVVGVTFVLIQGSFDLSIEGVMAASSMLVSLLIANSVTPYSFGWLAVAAALGLGAAFGLANGVLYTVLRLPSMIVTLATWFIGIGAATLMFPGRQPEILDGRLTVLVLDKSWGVSALVFIAIAIAILGYLLQNYSQFGRLSYAIGIDEKTTVQSGLPVRFHKIVAFALMGLLSGLGGVMISAQLGVGNPAAGQDFLFPAITAAVIGGTLLSGGRGGVVQSVLGVFILEVLRDGMVQLGVNPYLRHVVEGAIIIGALAIGNWRLRTKLRVVK